MEDDRLDEDTVSVFRPSYSETTLSCAGALLPGLKMPDYGEEQAAIGTVFHQLIAEWQLTEEEPRYLLGRIQQVSNGRDIFDVEIDEDMFIHAEECLRHVADIPGERFVETKVDISSLTPIPHQSGTVDLAILSPGILDVTDWKYGRIKIYAKYKKQLLCYAWGMFEKYDHLYEFETIRLRICQPRLNHYDVWELQRSDLVAFSAYARSRWALAWVPGAKRTPSPEACEWCRVRLGCPEFEALVSDIADASFDDADAQALAREAQAELVHPQSVETDHLVRIFSYRRVIEGWFSEIEKELLARGRQGDDLGGVWKVVQGLGRWRWVSEKTVRASLRSLQIPEEKLYERKAISPTRAEKVLRAYGIKPVTAKRYLRRLATRPSTQSRLVRADDPQLSVDEEVDDIFDDL